MGLPMCVNLVRTGYEVTASDKRAGPETDVRGAGGRWAALERYGPLDGELVAVALLGEQAGVRLRRNV
jgi:3-hydroxyisobutyrate dehydrogenase-like beta-hydroxyacid dehydrogenase